jgi:hypothetical protein
MTKHQLVSRFYPSVALAAALFGTLAGCSSEPSDSNTGGSTSMGGGSSTGGMSGGGATGLQGNFNIELLEESPPTAAFSKVIGVITDGPVPAQTQLKSDTKVGDCELLVPWAPFCPGGCGTSICTAENTCTAYPPGQNLGTVKITGLGDELTMEAAGGNSKSYQSSALPMPPCTENGAIALDSSMFDMQTKCIAPFELLSAVPIPVKTGKSVDLSWKAPGADTGARVKIKLDIAHHGGKKGEIQCDVADTGSFSIPADLVTKLVSLGLAGYPTIGVERYNAGAAANNANVKLRIGSAVERPVDTGIVSCGDEDPCPTGMMCDVNDRTCK